MKAARISGLGEISGTQTKVETEVAESGRCVYRGERLVSQSLSRPGLSRRPQHGASRIEVAGARPVHAWRLDIPPFSTASPFHMQWVDDPDGLNALDGTLDVIPGVQMPQGIFDRLKDNKRVVWGERSGV